MREWTMKIVGAILGGVWMGALVVVIAQSTAYARREGDVGMALPGVYVGVGFVGAMARAWWVRAVEAGVRWRLKDETADPA